MQVERENPELMQPNQNFLKYFPDAELPETKTGHPEAAACAWEHTLYCKIIEEYNLVELLGGILNSVIWDFFWIWRYTQSLQKTMLPSTIQTIHLTILFLQMG